MRVAVIGAGIIGVTTAYELAVDGHDVTVFERAAGVATEASFANAGVIAPGYVTPWAAPGMSWKVLRQLLSRHAAIRFGGWSALRQLPWLWRWWLACRPAVYEANRARMQRLAHYSRGRLHELTAALRLDYERSDGYVVLLRGARELAQVRPGLKVLTELGVEHELIDAKRCRALEPGLNPETKLHAAIHLAHDEVGNCRQFAHLLRAQAQLLGVRFLFQHEVLRIVPGAPLRIDVRALDGAAVPGNASTLDFDAAVLCAGVQGGPLLKALGCELPLAPVYGYSITAPLRALDGITQAGPRSALMDERYKVAISRLGQRLRVAGSAEIGGSPATTNDAAVATLHKVLHDWFPATAQNGQMQCWKGARPMLPDGPPVIGASGAPGVWLNMGHGSSGWALSCGSARLLADRLAGRTPAVDPTGYDIARLRAGTP